MTEGFDIQKHTLVAEHIKLNQEEVQKILEELKLSKGQLPQILIVDPAILHLEPKEGDVIKIKRKSPTIGETIFYRVVVSG